MMFVVESRTTKHSKPYRPAVRWADVYRRHILICQWIMNRLTAAGSMMGSGGLIVMDEDTCMVDIARFFMEFTQDESCGKCTPCRVGTRRILDILENICDGKGKMGILRTLEMLCKQIKATSLCGLGTGCTHSCGKYSETFPQRI